MYFEVKLHDLKTHTDLKWRKISPKSNMATLMAVLVRFYQKCDFQLYTKPSGLLVILFDVNNAFYRVEQGVCI